MVNQWLLTGSDLLADFLGIGFFESGHQNRFRASGGFNAKVGKQNSTAQFYGRDGPVADVFLIGPDQFSFFKMYAVSSQLDTVRKKKIPVR